MLEPAQQIILSALGVVCRLEIRGAKLRQAPQSFLFRRRHSVLTYGRALR